MSSAVTNAVLLRIPVFSWLRQVFSHIRIRRRERALRLGETVSLGEKRLLAVVEFEGQSFLIGVTNQSITLLRGLDDAVPQTQRNARGTDMDHDGGQN